MRDFESRASANSATPAKLCQPKYIKQSPRVFLLLHLERVVPKHRLSNEDFPFMDERKRQILATLAQMDKQFGKGSVLMLGSKAILPVEVISTGSISIDNALGAGGL